MDSTAPALKELHKILQRSHETLESELRTWISQQLAPPVAATSGPGVGEGCFEPEATDVIFPALETRLAKSSGLGPALRGDADEDALAADSSVQVSSLALPTFAGARPRRHSRTSKCSVCSADVGELSADVATVLSQVSSGRRSRWAEPEQEAMARMRSKKDGKKAAKPKPTKTVCRRMIEHPWFDRIFAFMIIASSVTVGAEVEYTALAMSNELPPIFAGLQILFFLAFLVELSIRLAAFRKSFFFAFDAGWNIFDLVVVIFAGIELAASYLFVNNHPFLTIVRMIRVVRFARIIRVVRFLRQLRVMVYTLFGTLPSLFWSGVLMAIILYLFANLLTQAVLEYLMMQPTPWSEDQTSLHRVFGNTAKTAYFLFQSVSNGTNWARDVQLLFELEIIYVFVFIMYVMITAFALLNVVTGFFCESAIEMAAADREQMVVEMLREKDTLMKEFRTVFDELDTDGSGAIEFEELEELLENPSMQAYLSHLHISTSGAWNIFKLLDKDETGSVSLEEFVEGLLSLKGLSKTIDIAALQYDVKKLGGVLRDFMEYVEHEFTKLGQLLPENSTNQSVGDIVPAL